MLELTEQTFQDEIAKPGLQVVDFWAPWCGPCRAMGAQLERAAGLRARYRFAKVNVDTEPGLASAFEIRSIPTLAVFLDGHLMALAAGLVSAEQLVPALDRLLAEPHPAVL